MTIIIILI